jgi:hypothetical protein
MKNILFLNHDKSQCGVHEIGKRIYSLLDKDIIPAVYAETHPHDLQCFLNIVEKYNPEKIIYNYYPGTMSFLNPDVTRKLDKIEHYGIFHDPMHPNFIRLVESLFGAYMIHDPTNKIPSYNKHLTVRPIPRFKTPNIPDGKLSIGSHGFALSPWKMYREIISLIQEEFDEVEININCPEATFGPGIPGDNYDEWKQIINKPNVNLNITHTYYDTEQELIEFLSKNHMNIYFYITNPGTNGVGGSADLAVAAQQSLIVNSTYMYRHLHKDIGFYEQTYSLKSFLDNRDKVQKIYKEWSPEVITNDYRKMLGL